ncbi:MAG: hypothetical protein IJT98_00395 [Prevotella sp.]|nr:hypothetical protein [Prevotella sp.]
MIVVILLALHFMPKISIGDTELRRVNVLSDILPEVMQSDDDLNFMPEIPVAPTATDNRNLIAIAADSSASPSQQAAGGPNHPADSTSPQAMAEMPMIPADSNATASTDAAAQAGPTPATNSEGQTLIVDYSGGRAGGMAYFFSQLSRSRQLGRPVRVAYYGDSFIEGDIFTADVREQLQDRFGGCGVGWVDCASQVSGFRTTVVHNTSGIKEYEVVKRPFSNANQGIAQRYFTASDGARITYKGSRVRKHLAQWDKAIFYLRTDGGLRLRTTLNGDTTVTDTISGSNSLQAIMRTAGTAPGDSLQRQRQMASVSYQVQAPGSGTLLFGVALEPFHGVVVDNFSMRGSAGYTLQQIPAATLSQFAAQRPYDLIVVHFGLNVANARQANYSGYTRQMGQAIEHLRQAYPQASILVVSMPDRDQRSGAGLRTMNGVEQLVAYQQIMASEHGVCFYNLFEAMGGRESMKNLVEQGMANRDYTHINFKGGRHLGRLFVESLMATYHSYGY